MIIEKFTDDEKRFFLGAIERERQSRITYWKKLCEDTDLYNSLMLKDEPQIKILKETDICDSIKNKIRNSALWS